MYGINFWNKLNLHWHKIALLLLMLCAGMDAQAQNTKKINLPIYDENNIHYGFLIGGHSSKYKIEYSDAFVSQGLDSLHSVIPSNLGGFKLGFVVNFLLYQYLDIRLLPTVAFYQNDLTYRFTDGTSVNELRDPTFVELPILFKYKSVRRGNTRMYLLGGINPSIRAAGKGEDNELKLLLKGTNLAFEFGVGFDLYQPLFKFSPELRYSFGLVDMLQDKKNVFSIPLRRVTTHNLTFYITFEGGPTEIRNIGKKNR
ncbi:MAG: PorT family protein [Cyclobacteriaceae bacterium]